jgi:hypothetical protein
MPSMTTSQPISSWSSRVRPPITGATVRIEGNRSSGRERMWSAGSGWLERHVSAQTDPDRAGQERGGPVSPMTTG